MFSIIKLPIYGDFCKYNKLIQLSQTKVEVNSSLKDNVVSGTDGCKKSGLGEPALEIFLLCARWGVSVHVQYSERSSTESVESSVAAWRIPSFSWNEALSGTLCENEKGDIKI